MQMSFSKNIDFIWKAIGHLGMILLMVLAYTLWLERSTTYDSSLYSYMLITRQSMYTPHDRYLNYLWQWIPLLSLKWGASLATFMKIMSLAPILFLYSIYITITHILKNALGGVYLVLVMLVMTRYKFYSAISEVYLGMAFVGLMLAFLTSSWAHDKSKSSGFLIGGGIIILCLSYLGHPLMFYPMITVIGLDYLYRGNWKSGEHISLGGVAIILFVVKYLNGTSSSHEGPVINNFFTSLSSGEFWHLYSLDIFWRYVETQWALPLVLVGLMLILLLKDKKFLFVIGLISAAMIWVVFVVHLGAYLEKPYLFMIEGYFLLLAPILFLPLMYLRLHSVWLKNVAAILALVLLIFGCHRIYSVRPFYTARIADVSQKVEQGKQLGHRNMITPAGEHMWDKHWYLWAIPYESLMLSTIHEDGESAVLMVNSYPDKKYLEQPFEVMIGIETDSLKNIQDTYFRFDTSRFVLLQ
jgi:hypothetical protein